MSTSSAELSTKVHLGAEEKKLGALTEHHPAKVRLNLAKWILGSVFFLFLFSGIALLFGPCDRLDQAKTIFEFSKDFGPPIVTLVIGFYFRSEGST